MKGLPRTRSRQADRIGRVSWSCLGEHVDPFHDLCEAAHNVDENPDSYQGKKFTTDHLVTPSNNPLFTIIHLKHIPVNDKDL